MSVSVQFLDCSWYHECDLTHLHDANVPNAVFRSAAVVRSLPAAATPGAETGAAAAALTLSRSYPARTVVAPSHTAALQAATRSVSDLSCISPEGLPIDSPHPPKALEALETALVGGRVRVLPHHLLRLTTINPDNVGETLGTLLSAVAIQADAPHRSYQLVWSHTQHQPTPKHVQSLLRRMAQYVWRDGVPVASSELDGAVVACYRGFTTVNTYGFSSRAVASSNAVTRLRALLRTAPRPLATTRLALNADADGAPSQPSAVLLVRPSGRTTNGRALLNEPAVVEAVRAVGFVTQAVNPAALSLAALAHTLARTSLLIGLHGAALAHCMWLPSGHATLVEAFLPDHAYGLYPLFARASGVLHLPLFTRWDDVDRRPATSMAAFRASAWSRWPDYTNASVLAQLHSCSERPLARGLERHNLFDRGHCVDLAKSADYTLPPRQVRVLATIALAHARRATAHRRPTRRRAPEVVGTTSNAQDGAMRTGGMRTGGAPTTLASRTDPTECEDAVVVGAERVVVLGEPSMRSPSGSHLGSHVFPRLLHALGLCPRLVVRSPTAATAAATEENTAPRATVGAGDTVGAVAGTSPAMGAVQWISNATVLVRVIADLSDWQRRPQLHGAMVVDLILPSAVRALEASPIHHALELVAPNGFLPFPFFCHPTLRPRTTNEPRVPLCGVPRRHLEAVLRLVQAARHPRADTASITQGPIFERVRRGMECPCPQSHVHLDPRRRRKPPSTVRTGSHH